MSAVAEELTGDEQERGIDVFSQRSVAHGAAEWRLEAVQPPARLRLYRARATEQYVLGEDDRRVPVPLCVESSPGRRPSRGGCGVITSSSAPRRRISCASSARSAACTHS